MTGLGLVVGDSRLQISQLGFKLGEGDSQGSDGDAAPLFVNAGQKLPGDDHVVGEAISDVGCFAHARTVSEVLR